MDVKIYLMSFCHIFRRLSLNAQLVFMQGDYFEMIIYKASSRCIDWGVRLPGNILSSF